MPPPPGDDPRTRYTQRLERRGLDPTHFALDARGTISRANAGAGADPGAGAASLRDLPVVRMTDRSGPLTDVRIHGVLGEGGMGRVLAAEQVALARDVAVKVLQSDAGAGAEVALLREALVTGRLEHPSVVPVHLLGRDTDGAPLLVMKRIEGVPWSRVLRAPASVPELLAGARDALDFHIEVFLRVCSAIQYAHSRGILHRDLKPENVMLGSFGEVYVVDWGLAVSLREDPQLPLARDERAVVGTPAYMAPEMTLGEGDALSERTDVYLLGAVLYDVLNGEPPHRGGSLIECLAHAFVSEPPEFGDDVPEELAAVCRRAMAREVADRPASVDELRRAVLDFRKHRASRELALHAERSARALSALLADEAASAGTSAGTSAGADPVALQRLFAECRFAYRQALAEWDGNEAAQRGLQAVLVAMLRRELRRANVDAAEALLAELPATDPALAEQVRSARREREAQGARIEELERFRKDADLSVGSELRVRAARSLAVFWFVTSCVAAALDHTGRWRFGYREAVGAIGLWSASHLVVSLVLRQNLKSNRAHRALMSAGALGNASQLAHWGLAWALGAPFQYALVSYMLWLATGWMLVAALLDRRVWLTSLAFALGALGVFVAPALRIEWFALAVLVGLGWLARAWRELLRSPAT